MCLKTSGRAFLLLLLPVVLLLGPRAGLAVVKLYMKDGTYELVKSYEVRGGRVRYYSIERSAWEEVPVSLVDLDATERAQREEKVEKEKILEEAREIDRQKYEKPQEAGYEITHGIHLPREEGVFAFDGIRVIRMIRSSAEVVTDKKRAVLLAISGPLLRNRAFVVLPGANAAVRILVQHPTFYVQLADGGGTRLEMIAVKPGKEARLVEKIEWRGGQGKPPVLKAAARLERTELAPGLVRLKLAVPLSKGEYALGELAQGKANLDLWDFGIDEPTKPKKSLD